MEPGRAGVGSVEPDRSAEAVVAADEHWTGRWAVVAVPRDDDGDPVTERMDAVWIGDPACEVPTTIGSPDADALSG